MAGKQITLANNLAKAKSVRELWVWNMKTERGTHTICPILAHKPYFASDVLTTRQSWLQLSSMVVGLNLDFAGYTYVLPGKIWKRYMRTEKQVLWSYWCEKLKFNTTCFCGFWTQIYETQETWNNNNKNQMSTPSDFCCFRTRCDYFLPLLSLFSAHKNPLVKLHYCQRWII